MSPRRTPQPATVDLPRYRCRRAAGRLAIDGDLDKAAWRAAAEVALVRVDDGGPTRQRTGLRLLWDDDHLYAAFRVADRDIRATHTRRDAALWREEVVELFLDPWGAGSVYVELELSPRNVVFDAIVVNRAPAGEPQRDLTTLRAWRCRGLRTAARVDGIVGGGPVSRGWSAELAIPLAELAPRLEPAPGVAWRFNAYRIDRAEDGDELQAFSPTGRPDFHLPARFGWLDFTLD